MGRDDTLQVANSEGRSLIGHTFSLHKEVGVSTGRESGGFCADFGPRQQLGPKRPLFHMRH